MKKASYSAEQLKMLSLLSHEYPTIQSVSAAIINYNATANLPKGTEHFMSDLHGEAEAFNHIMNNCSGVIREKVDGICCIKVLGSGCKSCHQLYDNTLKAVEGMGIEVEYVTDLQKIMEYGAMSMPALVINEKVVSVGRVLKPAEIAEIVEKY